MKFKFIAYILLLFVFKQTIALSENLDISVYTGTFDVIEFGPTIQYINKPLEKKDKYYCKNS